MKRQFGSQVLWSPRVRNKVDDTASIELVSSDMTGHIIHWDITIGTPLVVLQEGTKPVVGKKSLTILSIKHIQERFEINSYLLRKEVHLNKKLFYVFFNALYHKHFLPGDIQFQYLYLEMSTYKYQSISTSIVILRSFYFLFHCTLYSNNKFIWPKLKDENEIM